MNKLKITLVLLLVATVTFAQKSPRQQANGKIGDVTIDVDYGAPSVKERVIWGELVPYNKIWRAGANENTTISFDKDVTIQNNTLPAGKYGFFIIPSEGDEWEVVFSKKNDAWGTNGYDAANDQLRLKLKIKIAEETKELLAFTIVEKGVKFSWEKVRLTIPVK
jgi:hypothetical protein